MNQGFYFEIAQKVSINNADNPADGNYVITKRWLAN